MDHNDIQLLRFAALELQGNEHDLVRVAGIVQRIKNWWKAKFSKDFAERQEAVEDAYGTVKEPLTELIGQLSEIDSAFKNQDPDTVAKLVSVVPGTIARVTKDMNNLSERMRAAEAAIPTSYVDEDGNELTGDELRWARKGYHKNRDILALLWDKLPTEFKEIPIGQDVNKPVSSFKWFTRYNPSMIYISGTVLSQTEAHFREGLAREFPSEVLDDIVKAGFPGFIQNLKNKILSDAIIEQVNFPQVSSSVKQRPTNQMVITMKPGWVSVPVMGSEFLVHVGFVKINDLGAATRGRDQLSLVMVRTIRPAPGSWAQIKSQQTTESEVVEPVITADGQITKIVKRALLRERLPSTNLVVKIGGQTFHHKARFAKILSSALRQEIDATCSVRHSDDDIEVQVQIYGSESASVPAIYGISKYLADAFLQKTKIGIDIDVVSGLSSFGIMESSVLDSSLRKVTFDYLGGL